jgi:hypothetical protein
MSRYEQKSGCRFGIQKLSWPCKKGNRPFLKWLQTNTQGEYISYRTERTKAKRAVKIAHQDSRGKHISNTESEVQNRQTHAYGIAEH